MISSLINQVLGNDNALIRRLASHLDGLPRTLASRRALVVSISQENLGQGFNFGASCLAHFAIIASGSHRPTLTHPLGAAEMPSNVRLVNMYK